MIPTSRVEKRVREIHTIMKKRGYLSKTHAFVICENYHRDYEDYVTMYNYESYSVMIKLRNYKSQLEES